MEEEYMANYKERPVRVRCETFSRGMVLYQHVLCGAAASSGRTQDHWAGYDCKASMRCIIKSLDVTNLASCDADLLLVRQRYYAALAVQLALQTWEDPSFEWRNSSARILRISARTRIPSYRNTQWRTASARTRTFRTG